MRSCTQHVSTIVGDTSNLVASPELEPIKEEIGVVVCSLEKARHEHGGKKKYHLFLDMRGPRPARSKGEVVRFLWK